MIAFIRWITSLIIALVAILFAVANREQTIVVWSPVHEPLTLPLFLLVLGAAVIGFVFGGFMVWLNGAATRKEKRRQRKTIKKLEKQLKEEQELQDKAQAAKPEIVPVTTSLITRDQTDEDIYQ